MVAVMKTLSCHVKKVVSMKIKYVDIENSQEHKNFMVGIVKDCDDEFFPPLSARGGTTEKQLKINTHSNNSIDAYINNLCEQINVFATLEDGTLVGFMSIIHNRQDEPIFTSANHGTHNYITTVCVENEYRRLGICTALYDFIENNLPSEYVSDFTCTRTWCWNTNHIKLLEKRGYELIHIIERDRNHDGKTADTVFYAKKNKI